LKQLGLEDIPLTPQTQETVEKATEALNLFIQTKVQQTQDFMRQRGIALGQNLNP
jgi:hypothetical protein